MKLRIRIKFSEAQEAFINDWEHPFILFLAGIRSGKTLAGVVKDILALFRRPGVVGWVVSSDHNAGLVAWEMFFHLVPPEFVVRKDERGRRVWLVGDRLLEFRSAEDPESLIARGVDFVHLDEGGKVKKRVWQNIAGRHNPSADFRVWVTTTPYLVEGEGKYWLEEVFLDPETKWDGVAVYRSKTLDNPAFRPELVEGQGEKADRVRWIRQRAREQMLRVIQNEDPRFVKERYEGEIIRLGGMVYPSWGDGKRHMIRLPEGYTPTGLVFCGVDFGYNAPTVALWGEYDKAKDQLIIFDEYYQSRMSLDQHFGVIVNRYPQTRIYFRDPKAAQWGAELERFIGRSGVVVPAPSAEIMFGVSQIEGMLATGRLKVDVRCQQTIREFMVYSLNERTGKPIDKDNDCMDALRYLVTGIREHSGGVGSWQSLKETVLGFPMRVSLWTQLKAKHRGEPIVTSKS